MDVLIAAVDPGNTTGYAVAYFDEGEPPRLACVDEDSTSYVAIDNILYWLQTGRMQEHECLLVCESFVPRRGAKTWQPEALYIIGALRYLAEDEGVKMEMQSPANAKAFSTNDKLERMGWRRPSKGGHKDDALRHLLLAGVRHNVIDTEGLL